MGACKPQKPLLLIVFSTETGRHLPPLNGPVVVASIGVAATTARLPI